MQILAPRFDVLMPRMLPVTRIRQETADTLSFALDVGPFGDFRFHPGQFNMLYFLGWGEVPVPIAGDPAAPREVFHTLKAVGKPREALKSLKAGAHVGVRGPFGQGWPMELGYGKNLVIVAGGLGLAAVRPALMRALAERERFGDITLIYGARTPEELLYRRELWRWHKNRDLELIVTVDRGSPQWNGQTGVVTKYLPRVAHNPQNTLAFLAGPEVMLRFVSRELEHLGMLSRSIFVSTERNLSCGVGLCGHCQLGPYLVCRDGPVFALDQLTRYLAIREL